jgi:hypothetical protein
LEFAQGWIKTLKLDANDNLIAVNHFINTENPISPQSVDYFDGTTTFFARLVRIYSAAV